MLKPEEHWRPLDPVLHTCTTFSWLGRLFRKSFICCRVQKSCNMLSTQMHALEQAYAVHYVSDKLASTWRYQKQAINARASLSAMLWWLMTMYFLKFIVDFHQIHANACWLPSENNRYSLLCHYCKRSAQKTAPNLISLSLSLHRHLLTPNLMEATVSLGQSHEMLVAVHPHQHTGLLGKYRAVSQS